MKKHTHHIVGTAVMLIASLSTQRIVANAEAKLPAQCVDRTGAGSNITGGWAFVLNFNTGAPEGCLVTVNADGSRNYKVVPCGIEGDVVFSMYDAGGSGAAQFNPGGVMLCDIDVQSTEAGDMLRNRADYWMTAAASFPAAGRFSLLRYNNTVSFSADMSPAGNLLVKSAYGYDEFGFARDVGLGNRVFVGSYVNALSGMHEMQYTPIMSITERRFSSGAFPMKAIDFRNRGRMIVGSADSNAPMILDELILDPTGRCCSGG